MHEPVPPRVEAIARSAINAALVVHRNLGPGLLESVYEHCLAYELGRAGLRFQRQFSLPVVYADMQLEHGFRIDLLVEQELVIEVKAVDALAPVHTAQVLTYLKLTELRLGLLINFNVALLREGLKRVVR